MSDTSRDAKDAWVSRVLDVNPASTSQVTRPDPQHDPTSPPVGLVAYRKALLGFRAAIAQVNGQLQSFADMVADELPEEADLAGRVAAEVNAECDRLNDRIDTGIGAPSVGRAEENQKIHRAMVALIVRVRAHKLIAHVDKNPIMPMNIAATLTGALARVAETIV
jgi:hypothetical protein